MSKIVYGVPVAKYGSTVNGAVERVELSPAALAAIARPYVSQEAPPTQETWEQAFTRVLHGEDVLKQSARPVRRSRPWQWQ